jgi:hypothetical protein
MFFEKYAVIARVVFSHPKQSQILTMGLLHRKDQERGSQ